MPAQRPRASFEPISPDFDLGALVESNANFQYVDRISVDMIDEQGLAAFEKLVTLHVIIGGKPLVVDGFDNRLDPWTFSPKWLRDNAGERVEQARDQSKQEYVPLTMGHYLRNMGLLARQYYEKPNNYREKNRQRVYLKDIDCPPVWHDKLREHIPSTLFYLNESTAEAGGPGAVLDPSGRRVGRGLARAGDLMSSLPADMRAENMMCYIGHEGTYTPAHREMCASLGHNIMVEASSNVSEDGKPERPGSSIWFMTESKDRHTVSEYWLSVLGHDIETENHFAQVVAWKKAPFNVYVVEQRPGDFILIPPLAPHQVWNCGTRTMKAAWNRTTVETLELALDEALPKARVVCRDEQYKNKAIIYYTLQKYASLLILAQQQASRMTPEQGHRHLYTGKIKQLLKDFRRLFALYKRILLSEMFNPDDREGSKSIEYLPFDSNVTCAYCRGNIFNRFLTCPTETCKQVLGHTGEDPYDVCMDCYAMGRSCGCIANLKWCEQFRWKELTQKYDSWRNLIISLDGGVTEKTPMGLLEERKRLGKKTLAEVCREQLKRRPWKDISATSVEKDDDSADEEIQVTDEGVVKKTVKKRSKTWLKAHSWCHVCQKKHENWKMAFCTTCDQGWCYGTLYRGMDKMPIEIMEDPKWSCPHCTGVCFAGRCRKDPRQTPYEPKGTLLGHDTRKVADARSVEALVDFSVSNLNWLKDDAAVARTESSRIRRAAQEAAQAKELDPKLQAELEEENVNGGAEESRVDFEYSPEIDPALGDSSKATAHSARQAKQSNIDPTLTQDDEAAILQTLEQQNSSLPSPNAMLQGATPAGYAPVNTAGYTVPTAQMYPQPDNSTYRYPEVYQVPEELTAMEHDNLQAAPKGKRRAGDNGEEDINMQAHPKAKKARFSDIPTLAKPKNDASKQFEKEKERKALETAKAEGRFIAFQAALKGKRRIVKLKISGARLAQLVAQQAASQANMAHEEEVAEHEAGHDDGADMEDDITLLKSDIAPKTSKRSNQEIYKKREKDGFIITSMTRKAMIPVAKDDDYRCSRFEPQIRNEPRAKTRARRPGNEYEEVDIGSDDEEGDEIPVAATSANGASAQAHAPRRVPNYIQERYANDEDLPDELPENYKDRNPGAVKDKERIGRVTTGNATTSAALTNGAAAVQNETNHASAVPSKDDNASLRSTPLASQPKNRRNGGPMGKTAGKRPSMRPAKITHSQLDGADDATEAGWGLGINEPASPRFTLSTGRASPALGEKGVNAAPLAPNSTTTKRGRGRPPKHAKQPPPPMSVQGQNRLAKLHALEGPDDEMSTSESDLESEPMPTKAALAQQVRRSIFDRGGRKVIIRGRVPGPSGTVNQEHTADADRPDNYPRQPSSRSYRC